MGKDGQLEESATCGTLDYISSNPPTYLLSGLLPESACRVRGFYLDYPHFPASVIPGTSRERSVRARLQKRRLGIEPGLLYLVG